MNNDIKRILNSIQYSVDENDWFEMEGHNLKPLLDYITNLQEEYTKADDDRHELFDRIDKVVEYIRSNEWAKDYENSNCRTHLLNILQGEDK